MMLRIRFHGRGGQGMKTASRIVGTAAFRQGYYAQDSPVYGAERRGAPVVAFTRLAMQPILERGVIASPDLIVIADETLLADPLVKPLQGLAANGLVLVNSKRSFSEFGSADFTSLALAHTGSVAALSVAIGAAAARIAGLDESFVLQAVREEIETLVSDPSQLEKNLELARSPLLSGNGSRALIERPYSCDIQPVGAVYDRPRFVVQRPGDGVVRNVLTTPTYQGGWAGTASVATEPNTHLRKTGDWRVMRPVIDQSRCTHCWICFVNCPDGAIALTANHSPQIDYSVCKGCMLCAEECPIHVIESVREAELQ
jgi:pyruvate ferredoxin oxidoreductase gamma subunit